MKTYHKRKLPHIQPIGTTFFVTWNLNGAIPKAVLDQLKQVRNDALENIENNPRLLEEEKKALSFQSS